MTDCTLAVLKKDGELLVYALLSGICMLIVSASFILPDIMTKSYALPVIMIVTTVVSVSLEAESVTVSVKVSASEASTVPVAVVIASSSVTLPAWQGPAVT
jgi:hypothetical protein